MRNPKSNSTFNCDPVIWLAFPADGIVHIGLKNPSVHSPLGKDGLAQRLLHRSGGGEREKPIGFYQIASAAITHNEISPSSGLHRNQTLIETIKLYSSFSPKPVSCHFRHRNGWLFISHLPNIPLSPVLGCLEQERPL